MRKPRLIAQLTAAFLPLAGSALCAAALMSDELTAPGDAAQARPEQQAPPRRNDVPSEPPVTEERALHQIETEISRKVGLHMSEADYPQEAKRWKWSGITLVRVLVGKDGTFREVAVGKTSGFRMLDERAVSIVNRISAPSWIPPLLRGRDIAVLVPIGFILPPGH
jgi:periplasmic protein TonB